MTLLMRDQENQEIGEEKLSRLIERLMEDKRSQDIIKVTKDREYRKKMYQEYQID